MRIDLFPTCDHCWLFQIYWHNECSILETSSFRILNSSSGIPSPPALLPKAYLTSHSRMSDSEWVITPLQLSKSRCFLYNYSLYSLHLFLISSASIRSLQFSSVQFSLSVVSNSLWTHGLQHARLPCPSLTPGAYSDSCLSNKWCHPTISSSVIPSSSCLHFFPASGSFPRSQFFTSGGQSIGVSVSLSVLPVTIQDWFLLGWTGWISLQSKGLSRVFFNTTVQKHQFFGAQLSLESNSHIHTWLLEKPWLWLDRPLLAK